MVHKQTLWFSALSLILTCAMLVGATFAWFTDTASTGINRILAGNLDVTLEYFDGTDWVEVDENEPVFDNAALWEPGFAQVAYLRIRNTGSLALKYQLQIDILDEQMGYNDQDDFLLSEHLMMGVAKQSTIFASRQDAIDAVADSATELGQATEQSQLLAEETDYITLVVYMPTTVGNEANYRGMIPSVDLGITLAATQYAHEGDSFGSDYDESAPLS